MKTILVTGAHGGIGEAVIERLKAAGHKVVAVGRKDADLSKVSDIEKLQEKMLGEVDHVDWIVCAHGYIDPSTILEEQSPKSIEATFRINALSIIYLAQQFLQHIPAGGGIVAISSAAGVQPNGRMAAYSASKAAVNSFMQAMARNRSEQKFFALCPGPTNTAMRERIAGDAARMQSPAVVAEVVADLIDEKTQNKSGDIILVKDGTVSTVQKFDNSLQV